MNGDRGVVCATRKPGQSIVVTLEDGREIIITVRKIRGNDTTIAVDADKSISIQRVRE